MPSEVQPVWGSHTAPLALTGMGAFMALVGFWVRRKAAAGFGAMNEPGATEAIARATNDGDTL